MVWPNFDSEAAALASRLGGTVARLRIGGYSSTAVIAQTARPRAIDREVQRGALTGPEAAATQSQRSGAVRVSTSGSLC